MNEPSRRARRPHRSRAATSSRSSSPRQTLARAARPLDLAARRRGAARAGLRAARRRRAADRRPGALARARTQFAFPTRFPVTHRGHRAAGCAPACSTSPTACSSSSATATATPSAISASPTPRRPTARWRSTTSSAATRAVAAGPDGRGARRADRLGRGAVPPGADPPPRHRPTTAMPSASTAATASATAGSYRCAGRWTATARSTPRGGRHARRRRVPGHDRRPAAGRPTSRSSPPGRRSAPREVAYALDAVRTAGTAAGRATSTGSSATFAEYVGAEPRDRHVELHGRAAPRRCSPRASARATR